LTEVLSTVLRKGLGGPSRRLGYKVEKTRREKVKNRVVLLNRDMGEKKRKNAEVNEQRARKSKESRAEEEGGEQ